MFIFKSPDNENPKDRKRRLLYEQTRYALLLFGPKHRAKSAEYLSISIRSLFNHMKSFPDLEELIYESKKPMDNYNRKDLWPTKNPEDLFKTKKGVL